MRIFSFACCAVAVCLSPILAAEEHVRPEASLTFEKDIRPLLQAACFQCHGETDEVGGNLDLRLRRFLVQGGDSGPALVPGHPEESYLLDRIRSGEMPPSGSGHPLSAEQQQVLEQWIAASAPTLRSEPETLARGLVISLEDQNWWSFQPVQRPALPPVTREEQIAQPLDRFILSRLEQAGFQFSPEADRRTLIRRACFDLWGLPPTPEMVREFEADESPDAWEKLVDRLLADPHFGERWARHWLDIAGYADSEGVTTTDPERKWAWQYRDYVIRAFNANKPYDQFVLEQLAGDEMVAPPYKNMSPEDIDKLAATGYLRMAPDGTMASQLDIDLTRNEVIADTLEIVSGGLLGLTVECAQCHEHRYDPIPQADYYRMRAIFEPALNAKKWKTPQQRQLSLYTDEDRARALEIEREVLKIMDVRKTKLEEFLNRNFQKELDKLSEEERALASAARPLEEKDRTPEQKAVFKKYPSLAITAGSLYLYDKAAADELKKIDEEIAALRQKKPEEKFLRALTETPGEVPPTFVFYRGDHHQPREQVQPAGLSILQQVVPGEIPENDDSLPTTGRRLAFAKQLVDGRHPLTSRVFVNRMWLHLLGRGIVTTPADFGRLGERPSHPELLDWLAAEFVESGWNIKQFIRMVLLSRTYRQSLSSNPEYLAADPDMALFGSSRLKRLEAEVVRDMILSISGRLNTKAFGPPVPVMSDPVGQWVIGIENLSAGRPGPVIAMKGEDLRRSIYVQARRSRPLSMFETFDLPRMEPLCEQRNSSTVATQSLMLMNGDFVMTQADACARQLQAEFQSNTDAIIVRLWELIYARQPDQSEQADTRQFLEEQEATLAARAGKEDQPRQQALANLCQILLSSNEFLYLE
ncbi:MAG: PSD1 domain-containing protein [Planctomycetaceae bacterium]|nr:PSD1 domain-containing protein [Planctomycetaceae bacterium]